MAWETVECEKIVNVYCKKRYKANRLKLPKVIETMIYNSTAIQDLLKDCMETEDIFDIDSIWQVVNNKFTNQEN